MNFYIQYFFNNFLYYIFLAYHRIIQFITILSQKKIEFINPDKIYYSKILDKFEKAPENNYNIDPIFFDKKEFNEFMKTPNNSLESIWKTRILMESTSRGNIIMLYDAYKLGFSYYCDQNVVPYDILNTVAMKYVMTYRCYSFFIDELILPGKENPLITHYLEDKKENKKNDSFIKLKNYTSETKDSSIVKKEKEPMKNKFIYLGNIRNFNITQPIPKKNTINNFNSKLLDGITTNMSYNEFKLWKMKTSSSTE